jgi:hypothetical protein
MVWAPIIGESIRFGSALDGIPLTVRQIRRGGREQLSPRRAAAGWRRGPSSLGSGRCERRDLPAHHETGFSGGADTQVSRALGSTAGFSLLLSSLKAALEQDITLTVTMDAHPSNLELPS